MGEEEGLFWLCAGEPFWAIQLTDTEERLPLRQWEDMT